MSLFTFPQAEKRKLLFVFLAALAFALFITIGIFAKNGWFPSTDPLSGKRTGWFKSEPGAVATGFSAAPAAPPTATPQLSKEYIYAGSRLLAVEDPNANAAPPTDLAVWRPSTGVWYVLGGSGSQQTIEGWGQSGDIPVPGDYDGDGKTDFSVFRPSNNQWYVKYSSNGGISVFGFGADGDKTAQADYDGDGKTDAAIYRPSTGVWHIQGSSVGYYTVTWGGQTGDVPAPADYDGDGRADLGIWRGSNTSFYSINSRDQSLQTVPINQAGEPVSGDYDGDGKADYAVFNAATGYWYIRQSTTGSIYSPPTWGVSGDIPVQNDYDADSKVDTAIWRPSNGTWYIRQSSLIGQSGELRQVQWGQSGAFPVPAYYRRQQ